MLPLARFVADRVRGSAVVESRPRRIDVRRVAEDAALEDAARDYIAALPRWRRLGLVLRAPAAGPSRGALR